MLWKNSDPAKQKKTSHPEDPGFKAQEQRLKDIEQRIEEKISLLKVLEEKADKKIETLEKLLYAPIYVSGADGTSRRGNRTEEILALKEKGLDAPEIARILAVPAGEVELILDLNRK